MATGFEYQCLNCKEWFEAKKEAMYCTNRCRMAANRKSAAYRERENAQKREARSRMTPQEVKAESARQLERYHRRKQGGAS